MIYRVAPESDPGDFYAAGYDGNEFFTRAEAERAIVALVSMRGEWDIAWVVVEGEP